MRVTKLTIAFLLFVVCVPVTSQAQSQLDHQKKIYQSPEGKLYFNKSLPIYLRMSTSPEENAPSYLLQSEDSKAYTNPMFLDTEGYNTLRSPSKVDTITRKPIYPLEDIIFEIYADSKAPNTTISYGKKKYYKKDTILYFGTKLKISLTSRDLTTGVEDIYYSLNKAAYQKYTDTIDLNDETNYTIKYYAVDKVGNVEKAKK